MKNLCWIVIISSSLPFAEFNSIAACREPLLGYGTVNNLSAYQLLHTQQRYTSRPRWRHPTTGELREAVLPGGPSPGKQCRCNGTSDTTPPISTEEQCFLMGPLQGYITRLTTLSSVGRAESIWFESSATGSQVGSYSETGDSQRGHEAVNTEVEGTMALEAVGRQPVNRRLRRFSTCCSELQSVWINDRAIVTCSYDLQVFNKSNYQSKPRI
jgi:hypothetical protein